MAAVLKLVRQYYHNINAEYRSRLLPRIGRALLLLIETGAMYIAFWVSDDMAFSDIPQSDAAQIACLVIGTRSSATGDGRFYYLWAAITPNVIVRLRSRSACLSALL